MLRTTVQRLKSAWKSHGREILLFVGVLATGAVGFETGLVEGQSIQSKPLVIEVPNKESTLPATPSADAQKNPLGKTESTPVATSPSDSVPDKNCVFVGSKNSNKYHLPTCAFAKRIKPENRVCFISTADAEAKGYTAGCVK